MDFAGAQHKSTDLQIGSHEDARSRTHRDTFRVHEYISTRIRYNSKQFEQSQTNNHANHATYANSIATYIVKTSLANDYQWLSYPCHKIAQNITELSYPAPPELLLAALPAILVNPGQVNGRDM